MACYPCYDVRVSDTEVRHVNPAGKDAGPSKPQARVHLSFRINASGLTQLDEIAKAEGRSRGDVIRRLLAEGIRNWNRKTGASA